MTKELGIGISYLAALITVMGFGKDLIGDWRKTK